MNLKNLREARNLTQAELAEKLGVSRQAYNFWETGKRQPDNNTLIKLSKIFNVSTDCLLGLENPPILSRLKSERKKQGLTQEDVSNRLGFKSKSSYCQIESGLTEPNLATLIKLAEIYNTSVNYLLGLDDKSNNGNDTEEVADALHGFIIRVSSGNLGDYGPTESEIQILPDIIKLWMGIKERM